MKRTFVLILTSICLSANAQDMIVKKDGSVIQAKVEKIDFNEVEYKKWTNKSGPSYVISKDDILAINYENGEKETFTTKSDMTQDNNNLIASSESSVSFTPSDNLSPSELEARINSINPYTLFRKGSIAEYKFQKDGKDLAYMGGPTYVQQVVVDEKIEGGLLVPYVQQRFFNKKHNPLTDLSEKFLQSLYPTEIDAEGQFHLTHDISRDFLTIKSRKGYALLMPSTFEVGQNIPSSTLVDEVSVGLGTKYTMKRTYSNFTVEKMEQAITPAGTFDCVKITGDVHTEYARFISDEHYDMWIARGIGVVRLDITPITKKGKGEMYTMYLNHIELK